MIPAYGPAVRPSPGVATSGGSEQIVTEQSFQRVAIVNRGEPAGEVLDLQGSARAEHEEARGDPGGPRELRAEHGRQWSAGVLE